MARSGTRPKAKGIRFHGDGGTLFGIHIVNTFLTILTLGVYSFWGRVRVRNYTWGQMEFEKDRFSYHGTGLETFKGWLKALVVFFIPYILLRDGPKWAGASKGMVILGILLSLILIGFFIPVAVVGSRRYRLSRSAWRGIRFSFRGNWKKYLPVFWGGYLLTLITLGIYSPFYAVAIDWFLITHSYLGNRHFGFDGKGEDLLGYYLLALFLALPTLGISILWYFFYKMRYRWNHTTFGKARFQCDLTFPGMAGLWVVNLLMLIITAGFAYPWVQVRSIRYLTDHLTLIGPVNLRSIRQQARPVNATGEELASFLDLDFDLG